MCRLLAYAGHEPESAAEALGSEGFERFTALSELHRDGWGMAWVGQDGTVETRKSTTPAREDPEFRRLGERALGRAGFVHLRWATLGLAVEEANTHPFVADGWAFAHQGSIKPPEALDDLLEPAWRERRRGSTDSERYFLLILQSLEQEEGDLVRAVKRATGEIAARCDDASLNAVLLSPEALVFIHGREDIAPPPRDEILRVVGSEERIPPEHLDHYLRIRYRQDSSGVTVVHSGLGPDGFEDLAPSTMLLVELETLSVSLHPF